MRRLFWQANSLASSQPTEIKEYLHMKASATKCYGVNGRVLCRINPLRLHLSFPLVAGYKIQYQSPPSCRFDVRNIYWAFRSPFNQFQVSMAHASGRSSVALASKARASKSNLVTRWSSLLLLRYHGSIVKICFKLKNVQACYITSRIRPRPGKNKHLHSCESHPVICVPGMTSRYFRPAPSWSAKNQ